MTPESKGMGLGLFAVTAFGLTLPATRYIVPWLDPVFIGLGRGCSAALVALFSLLIKRQPWPTLSQLRRLAIVSLGVVIGFPVLSAWSMQTVEASHGGVILGILPLLTAVAGAMTSQEQPSLGFWITGIIGSALVGAYAWQDGGGAFSIGDLLLFIAVLSAAVGYAIGAQLTHELGGWQVICWALVIALPFILLPTWWYAPSTVTIMPPVAWLSFAYLALVSQLFGFFIWYHGLAIGGVARVSQTQLIQPFVTIVASALALSEIIDLPTMVFASLVVLTVAISRRMPVYQKTSQEI